jgi:broad specificity phosphatase PhoE
MLLVVRHADAGDKRGWEGPDMLRPLSSTGHRQAEGLVVRVEDYPVDRILWGPTLRCRQTVEPLARDRLLPVEPVPTLGVEPSPAQLLALFWDLELQNSVVCTHGEAIGLLLTRLLADVLLVEGPLDWPEGSTWLLERTDSRQVRGRYLAPLVFYGARTP